MPDMPIDELSIRVSANVNAASTAIRRLASTIDSLKNMRTNFAPIKNALSQLSGITKYAKDLDTASRGTADLAKALEKLSQVTINAEQITALSSAVQRLSGSASEIEKVGTALSSLARAAHATSKINGLKFFDMSAGIRSLNDAVAGLSESALSHLERYANALETIKSVTGRRSIGSSIGKLESAARKDEMSQFSSFEEWYDATAQRNHPEWFVEGAFKDNTERPPAQPARRPRNYSNETVDNRTSLERVSDALGLSVDEAKAKMEQLDDEARRIKETLEDLALKDLDPNEAIRAMKEDLAAIREDAKRTQEAVTDGLGAGMTDASQQVTTATEPIKNDFERLKDMATGAKEAVSEAFSNPETVQKMDDMGQKVSAFGKRWERFSQLKRPKFVTEFMGLAGPFVAAAGKMVSAIAKMPERLKKVSESFAKAKEKIADFKSQMAMAGPGGPGFSGLLGGIGTFASAGFGIVSAILPVVGTVLGVVGSIVKGVLNAVKTIIGIVVSAVQTIVKVITSIAGVIINIVTGIVKAILSVITSIIGTIVNVISGLVSAVVGVITRVVSMIVSVISSIASTIIGIVRSIISTIVNVIVGLIPVVVNVVGSIVSKIAGAIGTILSWMGKLTFAAGKMFAQFALSPFSGFVEDVKAVANALNGLLKRFARTAAFRIFRSAITNVGKALDEGRKNLYHFSEATSKVYSAQYAKTMDSYASSMLQFKNSIGAAVAPLLNSFIPVINTAVGAVVTLVNAINQLFAALSGSSVFTKATLAATKYDAATKGAGGSTKDLLADWDELNIIQSQGGGGGGGATPVSSMFEESKIGESIKKFAAELREAFESHDWNRLGGILGDKFNEIVKKINWAKIGQTIGNGFTAIVQTAYAALKKIDFVELGASFAETVNNALANMDMVTAGRTLARKITALWDLAMGFLGKLDYKQLGEKVHDALVGAFSELSEWFASKDWKQIGKTALEKLNEFITGLNFSEIAQSFFSLLGQAAVAATGFISGFVGPIWEKIKGYFQPYIDAAGGNIILGIFNGVTDTNGTIWDWVNTNIITPIDDAFEEAFGTRPVSDFINNVKETATPLVNSITGWLSGVAETLGVDITDFLKDPVGTIGIAWEGFKTWFAQTLYNSISGAAYSLGAWVESKLGLPAGTLTAKWQLFEKDLKAGFRGEKTEAGSLGYYLGQFIGNPAGTVTTLWNGFKDSLLKNITDIIGKDGLEKFKKGIKDFVTDPIGTVQSLWNGLVKSIEDKTGINISTALSNFGTFIQTNVIDLCNSASALWETFTTNLSQWLTDCGVDGDTLGEKIKNALIDPAPLINQAWTTVQNWVTDTVIPKITSALQSVLDTATNLINTLSQTIGIKVKATVTTTGAGINLDTGEKTTGTPTGISVEKTVQPGSPAQLFTDPKQFAIDSTLGASRVIGNVLTGGAWGNFVDSLSPKNTEVKKINRKATGDFHVPTGELFWARESGPEMIGKFGNHTGVANNEQIVDSISRGVSSASDREVELLREQNSLLRQLVAKDNSVKIVPSAQLGRVNARSAQMYERSTGGIG